MDRRETITARLAHPGVDADPDDLDPDDIDRVPETFADENRLWALLACTGVDVGERGSTDRQEHLFAELAELLPAFEQAGARVLLVKYPPLPKRHRDLDLLVVDGFEAVDRVLQERGYVVTGDGEPYKRGYELAADETTMDLDVHEEITWWGNVYLDSERLWSDRTERTLYGVSVPVPSLEHELAICIANAAFGEVRLNLFDVFTTWWLVQEGVDVDSASLAAERLGWDTQFWYIAGLLERVHRSVYDTELGLAPPTSRPERIQQLPYRYPIPKIIGLRVGKVRADRQRAGLRTALSSARGYVLELLQLGIDYVFYHTGLPKHSVFNMRSFIGESKR